MRCLWHAFLLLLAWPRSSLRTFLPPSAFQRLACRSARYRGSPINPPAQRPDRPEHPRTRAQDPLATRFFSVRCLEINQPSLSTARPVHELLSIDSIPYVKHPTAHRYRIAHLYFQRAIYIPEEIAYRWLWMLGRSLKAGVERSKQNIRCRSMKR